jgi:hypothetical protein
MGLEGLGCEAREAATPGAANALVTEMVPDFVRLIRGELGG